MENCQEGYSDGIRSNEIILKENIAAYYIKINQSMTSHRRKEFNDILMMPCGCMYRMINNGNTDQK